METEKWHGLETTLFDWDGWDSVDSMCIQFYDIVLKKQIGKYPIGTKFKYACIDFQSATLTLGQKDDNSDHESFTLTLEVKP
jgi:hypothetical protein